MTDTEMAQKTPADVHGLGENQYYSLHWAISSFTRSGVE